MTEERLIEVLDKTLKILGVVVILFIAFVGVFFSVDKPNIDLIIYKGEHDIEYHLAEPRIFGERR